MRIETRITLQIGFLTIAFFSSLAEPLGAVTMPPVSAPRAAVADFNGDGKPDYVLQNVSTRQTAIWYLNNNVFVSSGYGPTLPTDWDVISAADFDRDGHMDYVLFNSSNHRTAIWYLSGRVFLRGAYGPTVNSGWALVATADFNG